MIIYTLVMNILIITPDYPDRRRNVYPFVKQLVNEFAVQGHRCCVIAPYSVTKNKGFYQFQEIENNVTVLRPNFVSLSNLRIGGFSPSDYFYGKALGKAYKHLPFKPDVIYCHFWISAYAAFPYAKKNNIPLYVATGESNIKRIFTIPDDVDGFRNYVKGVICVSSKNKEESIELGLTTADKCKVFPNAVNTQLFHKRDKNECRKQLGLPNDAFIIAFVGWFIERKGPQRLADAIEKIGGVNSIFIGKGEQEPQCKGILLKGALPHDEVPFYLGAADCFVLPTLAEGCCNAVVEAMACGVPVISSNLSFNWDVLDDTNSIMIDPRNVDEIANAIQELKENPEKRKSLEVGALKKAESLTIGKRADGILKFMEI